LGVAVALPGGKAEGGQLIVEIVPENLAIYHKKIRLQIQICPPWPTPGPPFPVCPLRKEIDLS